MFDFFFPCGGDGNGVLRRVAFFFSCAHVLRPEATSFFFFPLPFLSRKAREESFPPTSTSPRGKNRRLLGSPSRVGGIEFVSLLAALALHDRRAAASRLLPFLLCLFPLPLELTLGGYLPLFSCAAVMIVGEDVLFFWMLHSFPSPADRGGGRRQRR